MKQKLRLFAIHQTTTNLQRTNNLNPRTRWYPTLDESNWMNPPISQFIRVKILLLKMVAGWNPFFFKSTGFTSSTFPIQPDFSQNQPAAITLNTGSPGTLFHLVVWRLHINICILMSASNVHNHSGHEGSTSPKPKINHGDNVWGDFWTFNRSRS